MNGSAYIPFCRMKIRNWRKAEFFLSDVEMTRISIIDLILFGTVFSVIYLTHTLLQLIQVSVCFCWLRRWINSQRPIQSFNHLHLLLSNSPRLFSIIKSLLFHLYHLTYRFPQIIHFSSFFLPLKMVFLQVSLIRLSCIAMCVICTLLDSIFVLYSSPRLLNSSPLCLILLSFLLLIFRESSSMLSSVASILMDCR